MPIAPDVRKAASILGAITLFEGFFVAQMVSRPIHFLTWTGFLPGKHTPTAAGWVAGAVVTLAFILGSVRLPSVRQNLIRPSWLKLLAIVLAFVAGILEEIAFRSDMMDPLRNHGVGPVLQVFLSGLVFGLMHGVWAFFKGSWRAGLGAIVATSLLGWALAAVYLLAGRSVAPCIAAHFLIDLFIEPGLMLSAIRGEMGAGRPAPGSAPASMAAPR
jgi:membrane protease YdiL (CAAX protease family)